MPAVETKYFGTLSFSEESVFHFPQGLPAFEEENSFVLMEACKEDAPLVFLQSATRSSLCFAAFPIQAVDKDYQLAIAREDLEDLGLDVERQPDLYTEVRVLALVSLNDELLATANLMAPIVLNMKTRCGLQAIRRDARYSHQHPVAAGVGGEKSAEGAC
jgi:flagellar assembly factor FliW